MQLFIDSANLREIEEMDRRGAIDGVTTNPTLIAKEGSSREDLVQEICRLTEKPVSVEVLSVEEEAMFREGRSLAKIHDCAVIKTPLTAEGLSASRRLSAEGIAVNVTLCFSPLQALMAAKTGAAYVSVFMGRLDDIGHNGAKIALDCHNTLKQYSFKAKTLAASVRNPQHILETAGGGVPAATAPYKTLKALLNHPLTDIGLEKFLKDSGQNV